MTDIEWLRGIARYSNDEGAKRCLAIADELEALNVAKVSAVRRIVSWLHARATTMNDPNAREVLNSAACALGEANKQGRLEPDMGELIALAYKRDPEAMRKATEDLLRESQVIPPRPLSDYTFDELRALPVFEPFGRDTYQVGDDGTVTLPNGRVLHGLTPGHNVNIPRRQDDLRAMFIGESPMTWRDEHGDYWAPVQTQEGIKRRRC